MKKRTKCLDCGKGFLRDEGEPWKVRCAPCYYRAKQPATGDASAFWRERAERAEVTMAELERLVAQQQRTLLMMDMNRQPVTSGIDRELAARIRQLLQYCHPDKHGGSQGATEVTQWLNGVKGRLPCG